MRGRPRISFIHNMEVGEEIEVPFKDLEKVKVLAYRINTKGERRFSFFTRDSKKWLRRIK